MNRNSCVEESVAIQRFHKEITVLVNKYSSVKDSNNLKIFVKEVSIQIKLINENVINLQNIVITEAMKDVIGVLCKTGY